MAGIYESMMSAQRMRLHSVAADSYRRQVAVQLESLRDSLTANVSDGVFDFTLELLDGLCDQARSVDALTNRSPIAHQ